jgi:hypothetical protein
MKDFMEEYKGLLKMYDDLLNKFGIDFDSSMPFKDVLTMTYEVQANYTIYGIYNQSNGPSYLIDFYYWSCMQAYTNAAIDKNGLSIEKFLKQESLPVNTLYVPSEHPNFSAFKPSSNMLTNAGVTAFVRALDAYARRYRAKIYLWYIKMKAVALINSNDYSECTYQTLDNIMDYVDTLEITFDTRPQESMPAIAQLDSYMNDHILRHQHTMVDYEKFLDNMSFSISG